MITVKIIGDSVNPAGVRLTSGILTYPRFIHSEIMTHRAFSRNAASSRAIPFTKMVEAVKTNAARPEYWGTEKKGMQSGDALNAYEEPIAKDIWEAAANEAIVFAKGLAGYNVHKSICNRLLEPFAHMTTLVTASQWGWENFFALRAHPAAQPEFQVLAYRMLRAYLNSTPQKLEWGQWHYPKFGGPSYEAGKATNYEELLKVATARCARLSYLTFDGEHSLEKDIALHDQLAQNGHWSPFEHCAKAINPLSYEIHGETDFPAYPWSNFDRFSMTSEIGSPVTMEPSYWGQYRKTFKEENRTGIDLQATLDAKPTWIQL